MNSNADHNYYMIRAMKQEKEDFNIFFNKQVVAVGWSRVDFSRITDTEKLVEEVENKYDFKGDRSPQTAGKSRNTIRRFKNLKKGDRIIVPYYNSFRLAVVHGNEFYDDSPDILNRDLSNQRIVKYEKTNDGLLTIYRTELTEGLQRRLRVPGSKVLDLSEFKSQLDRIWEKREGFKSYLLEKQEEIIKRFKKELLSRIRSGRTNLAAGGKGLENLVLELLKCENYQAVIQPKNKYKSGADADIEASKSDKFSSEKLVFQIKHHSGKSSNWGANQLKNIQDLSSEYRLVFLTSGEVDGKLKDFCEQNSIEPLDGNFLVDLIYDNISKLNRETLIELGIINTPRLLDM